MKESRLAAKAEVSRLFDSQVSRLFDSQGSHLKPADVPCNSPRQALNTNDLVHQITP